MGGVSEFREASSRTFEVSFCTLKNCFAAPELGRLKIRWAEPAMRPK
jgi:hypothetical protein